MVQVSILVEGRTDEHVAKRLLEYVDMEIGTVYGRQGKPHLLKHLPNYNKAAQRLPWFTLVDLDTSHPCPSQALNFWLPTPASKMCCRVVVHAIETWLMADKDQMAQFLAVSPSRFQHITDTEPNPKLALINIARSSRSNSVREDIVPRQSSGATEGPLYTARLTEFTDKYWRPHIAMQYSDSLRRCVNALQRLRFDIIKNNITS